MKKFKKNYSKKRKVCVITTSRADYGQLKNLMIILMKEKSLKFQLIAAGSHFLKKKGYSYKEIIKDRIPIAYKIKINTHKFQSVDISNYTGDHLKKFSMAFKKLKPDIVLLLGDRYETLSAAIAALIFNIPIAHLHGGEVTAGVIDESIRHSITKMSNIHFAANSEFKKRIIKMGEDKRNVYSVGALTAENIKDIKKLDKNKLEKIFKFKFLEKNLIITIHPEKEFKQTKNLVNNLFLSLKNLPKNILLIFTSPNSDKNSDYILKSISNFLKKNKNSLYIPNLGYENYVSCMKICNGIIGNSSSGITEAPVLKKNSINIGFRQKGRPLSKSIFQVDVDHKKITKAINVLFAKKIENKNLKNFYFKQGTKFKILKILKSKKFKNIKSKEFID